MFSAFSLKVSRRHAAQFFVRFRRQLIESQINGLRLRRQFFGDHGNERSYQKDRSWNSGLVGLAFRSDEHPPKGERHCHNTSHAMLAENASRLLFQVKSIGPEIDD